MIRPQEKEFSMAGLTTESSDNEVLDAVDKFPNLLERPIVLHKKRAAIGRPLDLIVSLLHDWIRRVSNLLKLYSDADSLNAGGNVFPPVLLLRK